MHIRATHIHFQTAAALLALALLGGCAPSPHAGPGHGLAGAHGAGMKAAGEDPERMCAMHRAMQAMSPEQRESAMAGHGKSMSPQARQQHMEAMRRKCE
ncbi:hypothetical protein [Pseudoduganella buxea]|uniref:Lipoprotein n=1 Tax=Pseudoduganella buxea TaxID=1949069 RepID=A0A6I3T2V6_9BURK|nr:hypothetical protein [Pseudoduganella buxea]MTV55739.1 hypothetical protein [Pseudoduganella buxea]GGC13391.1 hypothetical protein GCM10011572_38500 [Pseudoduganella buxea]